MSVVIYTMEALGILEPIQKGIAAIVVIGLVIFVLKRA